MSDFTYCPDCGQKNVSLRLRANGEDNYQCRNPKCEFFFFTMSHSPIDKEAEERWRSVNVNLES